MDNFQIETAQNVSISQNVANLGDRILAFFVDLLVIAAYIVLMSFLLEGMNLGMKEEWVYSLVLGLPPFLYHLMFETFRNGQSLGKAALKIRVVKLDGSKPAFSNYAIRWLLRIIDISLTSGGGAIVALLFNEKGQRLGDIAAGTTVISERKRLSIHETLATSIPENYTPVYPQVTVFSDTDMQTIKVMFNKAKRTNNHKIILSLTKRVEDVLQINSEQKPMFFIETIIKDYNYYTQQ